MAEELTRKLWGFVSDLNVGKIGWDAVQSGVVDKKERDEAFRILLDRGFVSYKAKGNYILVEKSSGRRLGPIQGGEELFFCRKRYAASFSIFSGRLGLHIRHVTDVNPIFSYEV